MSQLSLKEMNNEPPSILRTANLNSAAAYSFPAAYEGLTLNLCIFNIIISFICYLMHRNLLSLECTFLISRIYSHWLD